MANEIDVVPPDAPLPRLPVARAVWRPRPDSHTATESWLTDGGPHHIVLATTITAEELVDIANMTSTELILIDDNMTARNLANGLLWNQAYYRLVQAN